jgi:LmbE family N-acetylglucosaminyl deacetylase
VDQVDHLGRRVAARYVVDITSVIEQKEKMLASHASQRSWLQEQHGEDEYLHWMKRHGADRAADFGTPSVKYAEGYRPHLGSGFPKRELLTPALGDKVKTLA